MSAARRQARARLCGATIKRWRVPLAAALAVVSTRGLSQPATRKPRIGDLGCSADPVTLRSTVESVRQGLRELGRIEGQNLAPIEFLWVEAKDERFPALLGELLRLNLDLRVTVSPRPALLAYGPQFDDVYRRLASYVDRIHKGARPADLPVEQPTRFELVLNLRTAHGLGISLPKNLLAAADRVIQ